MKNNPFLNRNFVSAIINIDGSTNPSSDELWKKAHFITTTVAQYWARSRYTPLMCVLGLERLSRLTATPRQPC